MPKQQESNIAVSFFNIHNIITRSLRVSLENTQVILKGGFPDESTGEGFFNYLRAFSSVLKAHHLMEDEVAFPYFRDKLPEVDFDNLTFWHHWMHERLDEVNLAAEKFEKNNQLETELKNLENALSQLHDAWPYHIQPETDNFISKADALVPVEEQLRLVRLFAEHSLKLAVPHYLTIPFMLYNLPVEDRKVFSQGMPGEVLQNLIPVVWKEKWESMKPYLLA